MGMTDRIDMHCHVLPKLDDGARDEEESVLMLRAAFAQGFRAVIATPHGSPHFPESRPDRIKELCKELERRAQEEIFPNFRVFPGQEILYGSGTAEKLAAGELLTLAGGSFALTEFLPDTPYSDIYRAVRELRLCSYRPVLAHVERYRALRKDGRMEELTQAGAWMQMNYGAVGGRWYAETTRWCRRMLLDGRIHLLATDMHGAKERAPDTACADRWMEAHLEEEYIEDICQRNAQEILKASGENLTAQAERKGNT